MRRLLAVLMLSGLLFGTGCVFLDALMGTAPQEIVQPTSAPAPKGGVLVGYTATGQAVYSIPGTKGILPAVSAGLLGTGNPILELIGLATGAGVALYSSFKVGRKAATGEAMAATGQLLNSEWQTKAEGLGVLATLGKTNTTAAAVHKKLSATK